MDDIDARIVAFLVRDARASYALIGGEVGLSAPAVKRRVDRLRAAGAITGFSARVDPAAMGWTTEAYVELYCGGRTSPEEISAAVRRYPEVVDACTITGEADALVHIRARDVRHFEDVMERIRAESFVVRTKSVIVLSRLVDRADAPATLRLRCTESNILLGPDQLKSSPCRSLSKIRARAPDGSVPSSSAATTTPRGHGARRCLLPC